MHLRGAAVLGVMFFHIIQSAYGSQAWIEGPLVLRPFVLSGVGVAIFFVVSGFCIHTSHIISRERGYAGFFSRRFFRIYPMYFLALVAFSLGRDFSAPQLGSHVALIHNFSEPWFHGINPSFWAIAVECQLYCLYPLIFLAVRRWSWSAILWVTGILEFGIKFYSQFVGEVPFAVTHSAFAYSYSWTIGARLADAYLHREKVLPFAGKWHRIVWTTLFISPAVFAPNWAFLAFPMGALTGAAWISWAVRKDWTKTLQRWPVRALEFVGLISYSLFLIHQPILRDFAIEGAPHERLAWSLMLVIPIGVISYVLYRWLEIPIGRLGKRASRATNEYYERWRYAPA